MMPENFLKKVKIPINSESIRQKKGLFSVHEKDNIMNSENRVRKKYRHLFQAITLIYVISLISCNKNREKRPMTLSEQINTRDSAAVQGYFHQLANHLIKDTIRGTWHAIKTNQYEVFEIKLENIKNSDSIKGTYQFTAEGKSEEGIISGVITAGSIIAELYTPHPNAHKIKAKLSNWDKKYNTMWWQLQSSEQPPIPEVCLLYRDTRHQPKEIFLR